MSDIIALAEAGDLEAQRALARVSLDLVSQGAMPLAEGLDTAETYARMASQSRQAYDAFLIAGILFTRAGLTGEADDEGAVGFAAEGLAWLNAAADAGDEDAATYLAMIGDTGGVPHAAFKLAQAMCDAGKEMEA